MRKYWHIIIIATMLLSTAAAWSQPNNDMRQVYAEAESAYQLGQLEQAINIIQKNFNSFQGNTKQNALRLLSLCYLAQDNYEECERYVSMLLDANPYYTSTMDPVRFEDIVNLLKSGRSATITTASSQEESINEAPVPVTIITREMIDCLSNNKSIGQILATYVPGISEVCAYALSNYSMHGVYTSGQEKILVMENGHRLNARSTNNGKLDYAISTEKIDHIEVLRGPASSLYGNVALTAVINIITKKGREVDGIKLKYGYGSFGTHRADFTAGTSFMGADILAWASLYTSAGEKINIPKGTGYSQSHRDGHAYVGRYEGKPSYDIGLNLCVKDFTFMLSHKYGKQVPQYSWFGQVYDYDNYRHFQGNTIGYAIDETHLDIGYSKKFGAINLNVSVYGDKYRFYDYAVVSDSIVNVIIDDDYTPKRDDQGNLIYKTFKHLYQDINWEEYTIGGLAKIDAPYSLGTMKGNILAGIHWENFTLYDNESLIGEDYERFTTVVKESKNIINNGHETSFSAFVQCKHYFRDNFILNAGLRFDNKHRKNDVNVTAFSPRVALIYMPSKLLSTKISYSRAFVDAPYFYRQNTSNPYRGSQNLMPEYIDAIQIDLIGSLSSHFNFDVNLFYNRLTDLICNNQSTDLNAPKYVNSGSLKIAGIEAELEYKTSSFRSRLNTTLTRALDANQYYYDNHHIYSVPSWIVNLIGEKRLLHMPKHTLWLSGNLRYTSQTLNKANSQIKGSEDFYLSGYALLGLQLKYTYNNKIQLSLDCDNVFNTSYEIGGTTYIPYKYLGRILLGTVSFNL